MTVLLAAGHPGGHPLEAGYSMYLRSRAWPSRQDMPMWLPRRRPRMSSLFWRVFGANALVLIIAGLTLALSPATVSYAITLGEATTLAAGIAGMLLINLVLMRRSFTPLSTLAALMRRVDPLRPGQRVEFETHDRELSDLVASFNAMLDRLESERRASALREVQARDAEQRRIAGELHDEIGQQLTVMLMLLANAQADADQLTAERLQQARDLAHEIIDGLRDLVLGLRPQALDELGITKALDSLARGLEQRTGIFIERRLDDVDGVVSPVVGLVIYRVAQEALTNSVRHAPGAPVSLELECQPAGALRLRVSDRGPGLPAPEVSTQGAGLRWMAERAVLIGGTLDLESSSAGTTVTLTIPHPA